MINRKSKIFVCKGLNLKLLNERNENFHSVYNPKYCDFEVDFTADNAVLDSVNKDQAARSLQSDLELLCLKINK